MLLSSTTVPSADAQTAETATATADAPKPPVATPFKWKSYGVLVRPISDDLNGQWTPLAGADSWETPFAGINNVAFADGVEPWTRDISHGELLRDNYNQTPTIDAENLRLLYQGRDPQSRGNYSLLPYRLGLLKLDRSGE